MERKRQKLEAGPVYQHFPDVESIVIHMMYSQKGLGSAMRRTVNFSSGSYAFFRVDCLQKDCLDGGFDLTEVIKKMVVNRKETAKGELSCEGNGASSNHSAIDYEVAIRYS